MIPVFTLVSWELILDYYSEYRKNKVEEPLMHTDGFILFSSININPSGLVRQFTAALLDQHPQEPAVYLRCAELGPRGRCAVGHRPDLHGLLHHR